MEVENGFRFIEIDEHTLRLRAPTERELMLRTQNYTPDTTLVERPTGKIGYFAANGKGNVGVVQTPVLARSGNGKMSLRFVTNATSLFSKDDEQGLLKSMLEIDSATKAQYAGYVATGRPQFRAPR